MSDTNNWSEEFSVNGDKVMETVKSLMNEVTVRRIIVWRPDGSKMLDLPLAAGAVPLFLPPLWGWMALVAGVGWIAKYRITVERKGEIDFDELMNNLPTEDIVVEEDEDDAPAPKAAATPASAESTPAGPDDLTAVKGIGPKIAAALNAAGITTYRQLAAAGADQVQAAIEAAGVRAPTNIDAWIAQAQELAG